MSDTIHQKNKIQHIKSTSKASIYAVYCALIFLVSLLILSFVTDGSLSVLYFYLGASAITFIAYGWDKYKAHKGKWRTSENSLHTLAVIGGWPGAAFAQHFLRHKSQKSSFRWIYWLTVIVNIAALIVIENYFY